MSAGRLLLPQALSRIRSSKVGVTFPNKLFAITYALSLSCCFQNQLLLASISRGFLFSSSRHFSNSSHASRTAPFPSTQLRSFFRPQTFSLTRPIQLIATPRCVSLPAGSTGQPLFNVQKRFKCSKKPWFKPYKLKSHRCLILKKNQRTAAYVLCFCF